MPSRCLQDLVLACHMDSAWPWDNQAHVCRMLFYLDAVALAALGFCPPHKPHKTHKPHRLRVGQLTLMPVLPLPSSRMQVAGTGSLVSADHTR